MIVIRNNPKLTVKQRPLNLQALMNQMRGLSVKSALLVLIQKYRRANQSVYLDGRHFTVSRLLQELTAPELNLNCEYIDVRFFGGPPRVPRWFNGTILTLLCDAVLFEEMNDAPFEIALST